VSATTIPESDLSLLLRAAHFAAGKHRDQRRKGASGKPFISHPIEVATVLATVGGVTDPAVLAAALLHDTVEDSDTSFDELDREFGADVRSLVEEMTDDKTLDSPTQKRLQVEKAPHLSTRAKLIKLADKLCNVRDISFDSPPNWSLRRCREYVEWTKRVVDRCRGVNAALESLYDVHYAAGVAELEAQAVQEGQSRFKYGVPKFQRL
jgi:guanosine-3',5'-bis(diphosphate) 3'-pyrophosphohydrolase